MFFISVFEYPTYLDEVLLTRDAFFVKNCLKYKGQRFAEASSSCVQEDVFPRLSGSVAFPISSSLRRVFTLLLSTFFTPVQAFIAAINV